MENFGVFGGSSGGWGGGPGGTLRSRAKPGWTALPAVAGGGSFNGSGGGACRPWQFGNPAHPHGMGKTG